MQPLKEIIDEVKIDLKQFTNDDRINFLDEYLEAKADSLRATLIRQEITQGRIDDKYYQSACCIEVECCHQGCFIEGMKANSGTVIWKTKNLPNLIEAIGDNDIKYLGKDDFQHDFKRVSLSAFMNSSGDIWNRNETMFYIVGNTAYFKNLPTAGVKFICALGLWEKPTKVCNYNKAKDIYPVPSTYKLKMLMRIDVLKSWGYLLSDTIPTGEDKTISDPKAASQEVKSEQQGQQPQQ